MARRPKPWFRKATGWWMVTLGGQQRKLAEGRYNRKLAEEKFHELMLVSAESPDACDLRVLTVCELFLQWSQRHQSPETLRGYRFWLQSFSEACGEIQVDALKPFHVTAWVDGHDTWQSSTSHFNAIRSVLRAFNWATEQKVIAKNPLLGMKRPRPQARQTFMDDATYRALRRVARPQFKYFLTALRETGARPGEVRQLVWSQVQKDKWVLKKHKTSGKTGKPRVIWLTPLMQKILTALRAQAPDSQDHVFLNMYGRPWTTNSIRLQFKRLKDKAKVEGDVSAYQLRHAFVTRSLLNGVGEVTVAELVGHQGLEMIQRHYAHLADQSDHLREALRMATCRPKKKDA